jgi:hypothetical protein
MVLCRGGVSHLSCGHAHPSARTMAILCRCSFGMSRDAVGSRCGTSTPRHVFLRADLRAARFVWRYVHAWSGYSAPQRSGPRRDPFGCRATALACAELCSSRRCLCEPTFEPCPTGWIGTRARGVSYASTPQRIRQTATGAVAAGVPHRSGNAPCA